MPAVAWCQGGGEKIPASQYLACSPIPDLISSVELTLKFALSSVVLKWGEVLGIEREVLAAQPHRSHPSSSAPGCSPWRLSPSALWCCAAGVASAGSTELPAAVDAAAEFCAMRVASATGTFHCMMQPSPPTDTKLRRGREIAPGFGSGNSDSGVGGAEVQRQIHPLIVAGGPVMCMRNALVLPLQTHAHTHLHVHTNAEHVIIAHLPPPFKKIMAVDIFPWPPYDPAVQQLLGSCCC